MAKRRMLNRDIMDSTVMLNLAASNPDYELESQRIWQTLILLADDHGRGKYIPLIIKLKAFGGTPRTHSNITVEMVENWVRQLVDEGCIVIYEIDGGKYFILTKWWIHQDGVWNPGPSLLPEPPTEVLNLCWYQTKDGPAQGLSPGEGKPKKDKKPPKLESKSNPKLDLTLDPESNSKSNPELDPPQRKGKEIKGKEIKGKESKKASKSYDLDGFFLELIEFTYEMFPKESHLGWKKLDWFNQVDALDKLIRIDKFPQDEVFKVLRYMRGSDFWDRNFQSIPKLRANGQSKYRSARGQMKPEKKNVRPCDSDESKWDNQPKGVVDLGKFTSD